MNIFVAVTDVNWISHDGATPLMIACQERHVECACMLLVAGANPNISDHVNNYPLLEGTSPSLSLCLSDCLSLSLYISLSLSH